jgi:hypothetical protein
MESAGKVRIYTLITGQPPEKIKELSAPDGQAGDQFGAAVALSGGRLAIGAPTAHVREGRSGAVYTSAGSGSDWSLPQKLAADLLPGDQLGMALALDGDFLVAGAPAPFTAASRPGAVRVFRFETDQWREAEVLRPGNSEPRDLSGFAVAVRAGRIAVGAVLGDQGGPAAGAAWTFACGPPEDGCIEEREAVVPDQEACKHVGVAVALSESFLAVGASPGSLGGGAVYVFRKAAAGWRQEARLTSLHPEILDGFGTALALDGDILVVGAPKGRTDSNVSPPLEEMGGLVYVFRRTGTAWGLETLITPGEERAGSFGAAVALADGTLAVGAPANPKRGIGAGAVSVYHREGTEWLPDTLVTAPDGRPNDRFGSSVAVRGGTLAVGSPSAGSLNYIFYGLTRLSELPGDGAVYLFKSGGGGWVPDSRLVGSQALGRFGAALSLDGGTLAVGAPGQAPGAGGDVYLFTGPPWPPQGLRLSAASTVRFGAALVLQGDELLVGAPGSGNAFDPPGEVQRFQRSGTVWAAAGNVKAVTLVQGGEFGAALALDKGIFVVGSPGPFAGERVTVFAPLPEEAP